MVFKGRSISNLDPIKLSARSPNLIHGYGDKNPSNRGKWGAEIENY